MAQFVPKTASQLPAVPSGGLAGANIQAQVYELDTEKAPALGADDNYVTDAEKVAIGTIGDKLPKAGGTMSGDINFAGFKAIAMLCDSGTILPASPSNGQWFLHMPTGRQILMIYYSSWMPITSLGAITTYVDTTNGTDAQDKGFGSGSNAYKTIQYAINQIPGTLAGNVTINVAAGTYSENGIINGKIFRGNYSITIQGADPSDVLASQTASSGAARTITKTGGGWTVNAYKYLFITIDSGQGVGQERIVIANTSDTITINTDWVTIPNATSVFSIKTLPTIIAGTLTIDGITKVIVNNIKVKFSSYSNTTVTHTRVENYGTLSRAIYLKRAELNGSLLSIHSSTEFGLLAEANSFLNYLRNYAILDNTSTGLQLATGSNAYFEKASNTNSGTIRGNGGHGIYTSFCSTLYVWPVASSLYIENNTYWGALTEFNSNGVSLSYATYSGNGSGTYSAANGGVNT